MPDILYPPEPHEGETRQGWEARALNGWRMEIKQQFLAERGPLCERCGERRAQDLDEGIIPRSSMRGLPLEKRRRAFGSCNLFLLCAQCNREEAHQPEWAWERACTRYGERAVRDWYRGIGLRAPRCGWL